MSVVGIDLGTTNTVVGCVRTGKVHVLADEKGVRLLPSVVSFHPNGEVLVGVGAKARRVIDAKHTIYSHKRLIGRSWGSPEITKARSRFAFELREGPGQGPLVHARGQDYTLPEISAFVLKRARQIAEVALGTPVERAVITVPAHFNELQRASTKVAGRVSGLEVLRILNEPTAAALAYGLGRTGSERVAVYDFGGGTFDCTLLDLNGNVFEVLATAGDSFLGGDDVDSLIAERMAETFLKQHRQDARDDVQLFERLKTTAEDVKIALSTAESHTVVLKDFGHGSGGATLNFTFTLTRRDFEAMITPLVDRSFKVTQDALALARLTPSSFDKVILVGGSTRVPLIRRRVESFFGGPPMDRVNPDEVVAIGAAIQAAALTEGIRRRSLPAPPGLPHRPSQSDTQDNTQTAPLDPSMLKPAFASQPPSFGFASTVGSTPPDQFAFASNLDTTPPQQAVTARPSDPGVVPALPQTSPVAAPRPSTPRVGTTTARGLEPPPAPATQATEDDFSFASFPETTAPAPTEWSPSKGQLGAPTQPGASTPVGPGGPNSPEPNTLARAAPPSQPEAGRGRDAAPARGSEPSFGFGAIDEPPSLVSTSTSAATTVGPGRDGVGSPLGGEPTPWKQRDRSASALGSVPDLSLVSTTGVTSPGAEPRLSAHQPGPLSTDLTVQKSGPYPKDQLDRGAVNRADLPAVAKPAARKPESATTKEGGSPMVGRAAPPAVGAQPFGPTGRRDESTGRNDPPRSTPGAHPSPLLHPQPHPQRNAAPTPEVHARQPAPARGGPPPLAQTMPLAQRGPAPQAHPAPSPAQQRTGPMGAFGGAQAAPPHGAPAPFPSRGTPTLQGYSQPPPPAPHPQGFAAPPPQQQGSASMPPQHQPFSFGSSPPAMPGPAANYTEPMAAVSPPAENPQLFGAYPSAAPTSQPVRESARPFDPSAPLSSNVGAGYQAPVLVDVTPRGLVVETAGGYTDTIIPRNAKIPCDRTRRFATGRDMQTCVRVRVAQGESPTFGQNTFLGEVELSGLRPAARGEVTVAVTFEVDADGTLRVRARDVQTGQEARATLQLIGVADESSVVMMINRFAQQPVVGGPTQ